jgi:hypothetical protein
MLGTNSSQFYKTKGNKGRTRVFADFGYKELKVKQSKSN